ncbi:glycosyltransferase 87 family protein [Rhodococcus sp. 27YEA15]|uniref:glycosyltransferase 87 family protein n=1 Tax=Rhodococcus sp. 27YEA15 TaxID=3156259 RepID=UPI003C7CABD2
MSRWWQVVLLVVACALLATGFQALTGVHGDDLAVYRTAGQAVLDRSNLYDESFNARLPFTYPPFAALVAVPVALGSWGAVQWGWSFLSLLMLAAIIALSYRGVALTRRRPVAVYVGFLILWTATSPVSDHLGYGQVGLFLTLLCLVDVLARPRWLPAGVLVGIAGAVKLVPLVYLGYYLITGRWRAFAGGIAGFLGATALGFAILPQQSIDYFGHIASLSGRVAVGDPTVFGNQSVRGMELRILPDSLVSPVWLLSCLVLGAFGIWAARRAQRERGDLAGFTVVAVLAAAVTPIAWTHHFVWLVPAIGVLLTPIAGTGAQMRAVSRWAWAATGFTFVVVLLRLPRIGSDLDVPIVGFLLENSLLWASLVVVVALAAPDFGRRAAVRDGGSGPKAVHSG